MITTRPTGSGVEGDAALVQAAINAGADADAREERYGRTPLMLAANFNENAAVMQALIDAGADAAATNADGETAWDLIQENEALKGSDAYWRLNDLRFQ